MRAPLKAMRAYYLRLKVSWREQKPITKHSWHAARRSNKCIVPVADFADDASMTLIRTGYSAVSAVIVPEEDPVVLPSTRLLPSDLKTPLS